MKLCSDPYLRFKIYANQTRQRVLEMADKAKSGHVTTAFSLAELFVALYCGKIINFDPENPRNPDRDRFILSAGQAGIGIYPVLAMVGFFDETELDNFAGENSTLGVHSEPQTPGIEVLTGSLGHGLPIATGVADAGKVDGRDWLVFCLTGDGELFEGSNWEAMLTVSRLDLTNLILIVNRNHQFVIGFTDRKETQRDALLDPLDKKLDAFGFEVRTIDGHSFESIFQGFADIRTRKPEKPLAVIASTIKGKGSSLFAGQRMWHYRVPEDADYEKVQKELQEEEKELQRSFLQHGLQERVG